MERNKSLKQFYILWSTQSLSHLGSAMTSFALTLWLYEKTGSALSTAALMICTYAPYVVMSIFAGALSDKFDKRKTMLACDALAALTTVLVFILYRTDLLSMWHLYAVNVVSGLMNTVQQPASEVANTLVVPKEHYQKASALQSLSRSVVNIGTPLIASALYGLAGLDAVIAVDLVTFCRGFPRAPALYPAACCRQGCRKGRKGTETGQRRPALPEGSPAGAGRDPVHVGGEPGCLSV